MGRTKESYDAAAQAAFEQNLTEKLAGRSITNAETFGNLLGCKKDAALRYRKYPMEMRLTMVRSVVKVLKPDPFLLLEAVGYTKAEITRRCKEHLI